MELAAKAAKATDKAGITLDGDVSLAQAGPEESKTLLRMGLVTSAGAFQSIDDSGEYAPTRRPLELLDLVRAGTTDEGAVQYMRQTTYTSTAVEVAESSSLSTGTKPEATLPFEQIQSPVESIPSCLPVTTRSLADVDELKGQMTTSSYSMQGADLRLSYSQAPEPHRTSGAWTTRRGSNPGEGCRLGSAGTGEGHRPGGRGRLHPDRRRAPPGRLGGRGDRDPG